MKVKSGEIVRKYFHCYATANESRLYSKDIQNLMRIKNCNPGLGKIVLFIAISEVNKISSYDEFFVKTVKKIFLGHPSIELREIYFKDNVGRDFSSFQSLFEKVKKHPILRILSCSKIEVAMAHFMITGTGNM